LGEAGLDDFLRADDVDPLARPGLAAVFLGVLTGADASKRPARTPTSPARVVAVPGRTTTVTET